MRKLTKKEIEKKIKLAQKTLKSLKAKLVKKSKPRKVKGLKNSHKCVLS